MFQKKPTKKTPKTKLLRWDCKSAGVTKQRSRLWHNDRTILQICGIHGVPDVI